MEHTVIHDEKVNRFEVFESGQIAYLQYEEKDGVLDILHTMVPPQLEGMGIAIEDKTYLFICKNIFHTSFAIRGFIGIKTKKQCVGNPM